MKLSDRTAIVIILVAAVATALVAFASRQPASAHPPIDIAASNWAFTPATITVPVGEETTLRLTSTAGVHGLKSDELGIKPTTISPGSFATVTFRPTKAGTYKVYCSVFCGVGHAKMFLTIVVK